LTVMSSGPAACSAVVPGAYDHTWPSCSAALASLSRANEQTMQLRAGVAPDLGRIGKGAAADEVSAELLAADVPGVVGVLASLGGDLRAGGVAPAPHGWVVAVDDPLGTTAAAAPACWRWPRAPIATSTKLRRAWTGGDRSLHHLIDLIDPRTGEPAESGLASVTVVAGERVACRGVGHGGVRRRSRRRSGTGPGRRCHGALRHRRRRGRRARRTGHVPSLI